MSPCTLINWMFFQSPKARISDHDFGVNMASAPSESLLIGCCSSSCTLPWPGWSFSDFLCGSVFTVYPMFLISLQQSSGILWYFLCRVKKYLNWSGTIFFLKTLACFFRKWVIKSYSTQILIILTGGYLKINFTIS